MESRVTNQPMFFCANRSNTKIVPFDDPADSRPSAEACYICVALMCITVPMEQPRTKQSNSGIVLGISRWKPVDLTDVLC